MKPELFAKLELMTARAIAAESGREKPLAFADIAAVLVKRLSPDDLREVAEHGLRDMLLNIRRYPRPRFKGLVEKERARVALSRTTPDVSAEAAFRSRHRTARG